MAALHDDELRQRFVALSALLWRHRQFWRPQAFTQLHLPWENAVPALATALRALPLARAEVLSQHESALVDFLQPFIDDATSIAKLSHAPALDPTVAFGTLAEPYGVPGRKWQQIQAFAACVPIDNAPLIEWCSGKAHLGGFLARQARRAVIGLECNAQLVAAGNTLAQREQVPVRIEQADVLDPATSNYLDPHHSVVALHACGELHLQLLRSCIARKPRSLLLAPCCYQLTADAMYRPLSQAAVAHDLALSKTDLRTAVQGTATSPARVQHQRKQLQRWRLGFDRLQRELRGNDDYLPTPSLPLSVTRTSFEQCCRQLAAQRGLMLPPVIDFAYYESIGCARLCEVTALDLPRILFRRALELWLVLDRALWLSEHGLRVEVGTFCVPSLTPRNLAIRAVRTA